MGDEVKVTHKFFPEVILREIGLCRATTTSSIVTKTATQKDLGATQLPPMADPSSI
jgi:hypothetical protein